MVIKYTGENGRYKIKSKRLPFDAICEEKNGTKILLLTLKEIAETNGNVSMIIKSNKCKVENINKQIVKQLECPVCNELMRPPIRQCSTGHSFCNTCRPKLNNCPTCRQAWSDVRNFSLEGLTPVVLYSCMYNQYGCEAILSGSEINAHEEICEFKMYLCPISNCIFTGNYLSTKNHFKLNHAQSLIGSTVYRCNFGQNHNTNTLETVLYFFEYNNIYRLTFKRTRELCCWNIAIMNSYNSNNKYFYVITITDPKKDQRKMTKSNLCLKKDVALSDINSVSFSYNDLVSYKNTNNNDLITYSCELYEHKFKYFVNFS
ncbi:Sina domain containing protein [Asbolus verrucosus]|uniref:RING-type E3 ubiquitin transferase n=1 Tax=Asbolus verrucosus TaxID=1661398 RepID=A0A482VF86_ASBVE|nr:Sina domain containing protein [Asbolus verrucosus]